jgi:phage terminase large subunit
MDEQSTSLKLAPVQLLAKREFDNPQTTQILFGGGAGGSKTFLICLLAVLRCRDYPGVREGLGRKELKQLKRTTVATLLHKVHPALGIKDSDFKLNLDEGITYKNGSQIIFLDLAYQPSDPDMASLGSLELTDAFIDEAGEIHKKAADTLGSRVNRWMNKEHDIVGKTVLSCNPSQNFLRSDYYEPYERMGAGRIQKWEHGEVWVNGQLLTAYRAYIRSTVGDNSFIDENYIENLKQLPPQERKRLYVGDWNYADDDDSLFPSLLLDKGTAYQLPEPEEGIFNKFIGVDVSDKGKDQTIATLVENGIIITQKELKISDEDKKSEKPLSYLLADELIKFAQQNNFKPNFAKNIAVEGNGVGVGIRDSLRIRGWYIEVYEATGISRSLGYYNFMLDMDAGDIKVLHGIDDGVLRQQLAAHTYEMENQKPKVIKKDLLKMKLGRSPDNADSAMIANWVKRGGLKQKAKVSADNLFF